MANVLEVEKLLEFLAIVLKVRRLGPILDLQLCEMLYPFCREPLHPDLIFTLYSTGLLELNIFRRLTVIKRSTRFL
jgi:hypothetical protein